MAQLEEVLPHEVGLLGALGLGVDAVEGEAGLAGDVEAGDGQAVHLLLALGLARTLLQLAQAVLKIQIGKKIKS